MRYRLAIIGFLILAFISSSISYSDAKDLKSRDKNEKIIVTDCIGRKVAVPANVKRIGCLYAFAGHVVTMLGRCQDIVAISNGLQRDKLLLRMCPDIDNACIPKTGGGINIEELLKARVDVVFVPLDTGTDMAERRKLEKFHIPYLVIDYHSMEEQQNAISMVARAIGASDRAKKYNRYFKQCIKRVQIVTGKIPDNQRVRVYHSLLEPNRTDTKKSLTTDWLSIEGVINVAYKQDLKLFDGKTYASMEQILLWNPAVIIANEPSAFTEITQNRQWASIKAVKEGRVYQMPIGISRWGHFGSLETPLAILWTAKTIYPERFSDIDMTAETKAFYKEFFNYELSDELLSHILSGQGMRFPKHRDRKHIKD
jgi:iron complex transport system substrate-binding protein